MPVDDNSVHHRMRMLNPGETFEVPFSDYGKVRAAEHILRRDFGLNVTHTLVGGPRDPDRKIVIHRYAPGEDPTPQQELKRKSRIMLHENMLEYHIREVFRLCPECRKKIASSISKLIKTLNEKEETEDTDKI